MGKSELLFQLIRDIAGRDRTEQSAALTRLCTDHQLFAFELCSLIGGLLLCNVNLVLCRGLLSLQLIQICIGCLRSKALSDQEVPCIAVGNILDLAFFAGTFYILQQYNLHVITHPFIHAVRRQQISVSV